MAYLQGRAGAPRLICCEPKAGIIVMEYLGPYTLSSVISSRRVRDDHECYELMLSLARQL